MELRNLVTFLKVSELCHFTKAAESLGYVQSTVTAQIKQLEEEIGSPLFERFGKKIMLTEVGEKLLTYAHRIVELSEQAATVGTRQDQVKGMLRIGTVQSLYTARLSNYIPNFLNSFPLVTLKIEIATGAELIRALLQNELDIIYLLDKHIMLPELTCVSSMSEEIVFACSKGNALAGKQGLTLKDIVKQKLILPESSGLYRRALEELMLHEGYSIQPIAEVNDTAAIVALLTKVDGVTFLPRYAVREYADNDFLSILDVSEKVEFASQLIYHKDKWITPAMNAFIEIVGGK